MKGPVKIEPFDPSLDGTADLAQTHKGSTMKIKGPVKYEPFDPPLDGTAPADLA